MLKVSVLVFCLVRGVGCFLSTCWFANFFWGVFCFACYEGFVDDDGVGVVAVGALVDAEGGCGEGGFVAGAALVEETPLGAVAAVPCGDGFCGFPAAGAGGDHGFLGGVG